MKFANRTLTAEGKLWLAEQHAIQSKEYEARSAHFYFLLQKGRKEEADKEFDQVLRLADQLLAARRALSGGELCFYVR